MTPPWPLGSGVRRWFAETNGSTKFVHENAESKLTEFQSERFGVLGHLTYRFSTS
jgi:predicted NUDIX family NTP pyrophosphohydrolase